MSTIDPRIEVTELGGGWYEINAPWLEEADKVHGAKARDKRVKELSEFAPDDDGDTEPELPPAGVVESLEPNIVQGPEDKDPDMVVDSAPKLKINKFEGTMDAKERKAVGMPATTRIILEENDDIPPTGLFISHNGKGYMIRAGEPVDVPNFLVEILDNAVMARPVLEPQTGRVLGWRDRLRYPYRRVR